MIDIERQVSFQSAATWTEESEPNYFPVDASQLSARGHARVPIIRVQAKPVAVMSPFVAKAFYGHSRRPSESWCELNGARISLGANYPARIIGSWVNLFQVDDDTSHRRCGLWVAVAYHLTHYVLLLSHDSPIQTPLSRPSVLPCARSNRSLLVSSTSPSAPSWPCALTLRQIDARPDGCGSTKSPDVSLVCCVHGVSNSLSQYFCAASFRH